MGAGSPGPECRARDASGRRSYHNACALRAFTATQARAFPLAVGRRRANGWPAYMLRRYCPPTSNNAFVI